MKPPTLITLLMLASLCGKGQKDSGIQWHFGTSKDYPRATFTEIYFQYSYGDGKTIRVGYVIKKGAKDSTFFIDGDTVALMKMMLKSSWEAFEENAKKQNKLRETIKSGVDFLNDLPPYFRDKTVNPSWPGYWENLIKQGYRVTQEKIKINKQL